MLTVCEASGRAGVWVQDQQFAADLERLRLDVGLSLRALVRSSGVPRSTLSDALAGRRFPRLDAVLAIVRACGADPDPWRKRWAALKSQQRPQSTGASATDPTVARTPAPARMATSASSSARATRQAPVPAQLPRDVSGFTSREREMARLDRAGIALIHGSPGIGKTALAVHWAHAAADRYPDGQLFLNLRGHHPTLGPMSPVEAIGRMLGSLGIPWAPLNEDPDEGASLWRSSVAGRRMLILLDDAVSADQIRPLLPGASGSALIVTSRHYLADLIVCDGAEGIVLDVLPPEGSTALLGHVCGPARIWAEPAAAAAIALACGHLPLALRLAGAVVAGAPERTFSDLSMELTAGDRLTALDALGLPSALERTFELSYRVLPEDARCLFRRLGLHSGPDITVEVAALLAGRDPDDAGRLLRLLAEAHLIEPGRAHRYRMHDLLRDYAARLVEEADAATERDRARDRLLDWYVDRALGVCDRLDTGRERLWIGENLRSSWKPDDDEAAAWLELEYRNVVAAIEDDARRGTGRYAWTLVDLFAGVLSRGRDVSGLLAATDASLAAARRQGDTHAEAVMCQRRGWWRCRAGQSAGAATDFARAREVFAAAGARRAEAAALRGLAVSYAEVGRLTEGRERAEQSLALYRAEGDRTGQSAALSALAVITSQAADFPAATGYVEQALALRRAAGSRGDIAQALANLAYGYGIRGMLSQALTCTEAAVEIAREVGDGLVETLGLVNGALAHLQAGSGPEAHSWASAAVARARALGYRFGEAGALDALASAYSQLGQAGGPELRSRALRLSDRAGNPVTQAEILVGTARDAFRAAVEASPPADRALRAAQEAAQRALDAGILGHAPHWQAEALALLAACDLASGKVADAVTAARQAVAMHAASGARLAEVTARCVLAHALSQDGDRDGADLQRRTARQILDEREIPEAAPTRRMLDATTFSALPRFI